MYHVVLTDTAPAKERHMKSLRHAAGASLAVVAVAVSGCTYASEESAAPEGNSSDGG
ncbi:ABC transporter substrate-binding protein, partial [Cutibacterium acnes]